ncbi:MAG: sigma-54-dependent Fis family transcriptional regulator [Deltaproteobacteria bacterium]|nr:sigma-54-dependent Fis family transcriptional regulator [Deltaproteobacteria bacterium]MBW2071204.1 sigma-54-dependent Fis family transcriptional regulator [Deltaproteobacteria bacterium]
MTSQEIYIIEDDDDLRDILETGLLTRYRVRSFANATTGLKAIRQHPPDLLLLDVMLPDINGIEVLREVRNIQPQTVVVMMTASGDLQTAVAAMKLGAYDYISKPINMDALDMSIQNAFEKIRLRKEVQALQETYLRENVPCFIGESNAIQGVMQVVDKVARAQYTPVLIVGETGTGKELIANAIHYKSPHFNGPFITLNCSAIPRELIESELFGYEKGAFTGAHTSGKQGLVEQAASGTLFLDEVGDLSIEAQAKLLRFLEEGEYYRVGGTKKLHIRTRVVSATNKDLETMTEEGLFRRDLYYRLAVIKLEIPSLNERREDIVPIAKHFLAEFNQKHDKSFRGFTREAEKGLREHVWKGNVRELRNVVERGVLIGEGSELSIEDLGIKSGASGGLLQEEGDAGQFPPLPENGIDLQALERHYMKEAYERAGGNETKAARLLGMTYYRYRYRRKKIKDF